MAGESDLLWPPDHARAIGSALLTFNLLESELAGLIAALADTPDCITELEALQFFQKDKRLVDLVSMEADSSMRRKLQTTRDEAYELSRRRNELAHGMLWWDPVDRCLMHRIARLEGKPKNRKAAIEHDEKSVEEIGRIADRMYETALNAGAIAAELRVTRGRPALSLP